MKPVKSMAFTVKCLFTNNITLPFMTIALIGAIKLGASLKWSSMVAIVAEAICMCS